MAEGVGVAELFEAGGSKVGTEGGGVSQGVVGGKNCLGRNPDVGMVGSRSDDGGDALGRGAEVAEGGAEGSGGGALFAFDRIAGYVWGGYGGRGQQRLADVRFFLPAVNYRFADFLRLYGP